MSVLAPGEIGDLLGSYLARAVPGWQEQLDARPRLLEQLSVYLDLLVLWNGRTNLSAIREPKEIVRRHFAESLFAALYLGGAGQLLDLGSGAGFPGLPMQLWHSGLAVTLAESQGKKAAFLREVVRSLDLPTEVWSGRAEQMPQERLFNAVVMRAVDVPERALRTAFSLTLTDVWVLGSEATLGNLAGACLVSWVLIPGRTDSFLFRLRRELFHVEQS